MTTHRQLYQLQQGVPVMNKFGHYFLGTAVIALLSALPLMAQQGDTPEQPITTATTVHWFKDDSTVEGSHAILTRMEHGISMSLDTSGMEPDGAYTIWWLIFNVPENCSDSVCGINDVYLMDDSSNFILDGNGQRQLNRPIIEAARASALWAAGNIAFRNRTATFEGHLPVGDTSGNVWFGPDGLLDPMKAVVHLIVREHGPAVPGDSLRKQLFTFDGGMCPNPINKAPCKNIQYALFEPPE
jgi:hypothetical protein